MTLRFVTLTRPNARKLEAGQKLTEHGITFERLPSGDGVYSVNIMVDGIRIHRRIGTEAAGTTREQCEHRKNPHRCQGWPPELAEGPKGGSGLRESR